MAKVPDPINYLHSGKMIALKEILQQLGFPTHEDQKEQGDIITANLNKVLVFSRFKMAL
jgi:TATA-binding protein-associated factor